MNGIVMAILAAWALWGWGRATWRKILLNNYELLGMFEAELDLVTSHLYTIVDKENTLRGSNVTMLYRGRQSIVGRNPKIYSDVPSESASPIRVVTTFNPHSCAISVIATLNGKVIGPKTVVGVTIINGVRTIDDVNGDKLKEFGKALVAMATI